MPRCSTSFFDPTCLGFASDRRMTCRASTSTRTACHGASRLGPMKCARDRRRHAPGFNLDENGVQRQERIGFDGMRPGLAPPPGVENPVQLAPPQLPARLYNLATMPLPSLSNAFDPVSGRRIVPYAPLINPVRFYPTT